MTVGILVVIPGGVIAVADGRTSMVYQNEVVSDTTQKIVAGPGNTMLITFGVTNVTAMAVALLQACPSPKSGLEAITLAKACLTQAWRSFATALAPDVDRAHSALRAALMIAGIDQTGPYIGAAMDSFEPPLSVGPAYGIYNHVVLGGEKYGSFEIFVRELAEARSHINSEDQKTAIGHKVVQAAANTIRAIANSDRTVGGQTHYRMQLTSGAILEANL